MDFGKKGDYFYISQRALLVSWTGKLQNLKNLCYFFQPTRPLSGKASIERLRWSKEQLELIQLPPVLWGKRLNNLKNVLLVLNMNNFPYFKRYLMNFAFVPSLRLENQ